jgi:hypothetical protein
MARDPGNLKTGHLRLLILLTKLTQKGVQEPAIEALVCILKMSPC